MKMKLNETQVTQIKDALAAGSKIEAIKYYREATGLGLKEAKDFIDALVVELKKSEPHKYEKLQSQGSGCASLFLVFFAFISFTSFINNFIL